MLVGVELQAAPVAAGTLSAPEIDGGMAQLPAKADGPVIHVPVEDHSQSDAVLHLQIDKFGILPADAVERLCQRTCRRIVNQEAGQLEPLL